MPGEDEGGSGESTPPSGTAAKTFTQEEVNALMGNTRTKAKETAVKDLLKVLGVEDEAAAQTLIKQAKDAEQANATELDKARKAHTETEGKLTKVNSELDQSKLTTAVEKALIREGLSVDAAEKVRPMVQVNKLDDDEIKTAIEELKKSLPALFSTAPAGGPPGHNPGSPPGGGSGKPNDPAAQALATLYERHPNLKTKSAG